MATGATVSKHWRKYIGGYDLSGYTSNIGPLTCTFEEGEFAPQNAELKGKWLGQVTAMSPGALNGIFDNTAATGLHALMSSPGTSKIVTVAIGIQAAPAMGDPVYCGEFDQLDYAVVTGTPVAANIQFGNVAATMDALNYETPWGNLLHANGAETGANSSTGYDGLAQSLLGGYMVYHVLTAAGAGDQTATIKVQHADANVDGSFADLVSSGVINCGSGGTAVPTAGIVALAKGATVKQYLRWQLALGTATSVTFVLSFVRSFI
jgi:hypothetical protein